MASNAPPYSRLMASVPYDGWCSKGGAWAASSFLPVGGLITALVSGHIEDTLTWQYILVCAGCFLVSFFVLALLAKYCGEYDFQIWALQHPRNPISVVWLTLLVCFQSLESCNNEWMHKRRLKYGSNFVCAGQVLLGEHEEVERTLTAPQARTYYLGQTRFIKRRCPGDDVKQRSTFLLALSDEGAGGDGSHAKFKGCMARYFFGSSDMVARRQDEVGRRMIDQLKKDYRERRADFFKLQGPLEMFVITYLTYVLFGIDLKGDDLKVMTDWLLGNGGTAHYMYPSGYLMNNTKLIDKVAAIYERAPALQMFEEGIAAHAKMTKQELARMMTAVIRIAGKTGTLQLLETVLGGRSMPKYKGEPTGQIDVTRAWDGLDLDNRDELKRFTIEVARLYPPVNAVHRVAQEDFTCDFNGRSVSFPAGTLVMVPVVFGNLDRDFWGPTVYELDHNRPKLSEHFLGFNSVGDRNAGRICPGRELTLDICADLLSELGRVRRLGCAASTVV
mmetsp:Transcript_35618/g.102624  ORF Transcript_35618/g.102624 Transcript_35618/m.102624 type:complete len:503 (+) Transcript_35618:73-1581(+)